MTNYNERLDEILRLVFNYGYNEAVVELDPIDRGYDKFNKSTSPDIAKQAITSLTKELVAEAKPEKRTPDYYSDSIDLYSRQCAANSWNKAIDEFEQNLLKALEEGESV